MEERAQPPGAAPARGRATYALKRQLRRRVRIRRAAGREAARPIYIPLFNSYLSLRGRPGALPFQAGSPHPMHLREMEQQYVPDTVSSGGHPIEERGYAHPEVLVTTTGVAQNAGGSHGTPGGIDEDSCCTTPATSPGRGKVDWTNTSTISGEPGLRGPGALQSGCSASRGSTRRRPSCSTATRTTGGPPTPSGCSSCSGSRTSRSWTAAAPDGRPRGAR